MEATEFEVAVAGGEASCMVLNHACPKMRKVVFVAFYDLSEPVVNVIA